MDSDNWRTAQAMGGDAVVSPGMDGYDWRTALQPDSRHRIVNKIMDTLKKHLPFSGQEGLQELKKIAVRFEEKIYIEATSQQDYLRKISLKMLGMESTSQNPIANSLQPNAASSNRNPQDPDPIMINPEQHSTNLSRSSTANETEQVKLARNLLRTVEEELMADYLTIENAYKALGGDI